MIVVLRERGLRVLIYRFDHEPPHVHVIGDGIAKIILTGADSRPELVYAKGMNTAEQRRAMKAVREAQLQLLQHWRDIHG